MDVVIGRRADPAVRDAARRLDREHVLTEAARKVVGAGITVLRVAPDAWLVNEQNLPGAVRTLRSAGWRPDAAVAPDAFVHPRGGMLQVGIAPPIEGISVRRRRRLGMRLWADAVPAGDGWLVPTDAAAADVGNAERRAAAAPGGLVWSFREERKLHAEGYGWIGRPTTRVAFAGEDFIVPRGVYPAKRVTERVVRRCLERIDGVEDPLVVDVGTGAGVVAVTVALARPDAQVVAVDRSPRAARAARRNARAQGTKVDVRLGDLLAPLPATLHGRVDTVCANVPYVTPWLAADPGYGAPRSTVAGAEADGLGSLRRLAAAATGFLVRGGSFVFQVADTQWNGLRDDLAALGYRPEDPDVRNPGFAIVASARWMEET